MGETVKRNTKQKSAVRHALSEAVGFVSAQQLHQVLKNHGSSTSLATVYRALGELVSSGEADSLQSADGEFLYRDCGKGHHHHLICRVCGQTVEIEAEKVESWADQVAKAMDFHPPATPLTSLGPVVPARKKLQSRQKLA